MPSSAFGSSARAASKDFFKCVEGCGRYRAAGTEHGNDESQADGNFCCGYGYDKQSKYLRIVHRYAIHAVSARESYQ